MEICCSFALEDEGGRVQLCKALVAWREGVSLTEEEIEVLSCVFSIFDAGASGSVRCCKCRYTFTHTHMHTAHGVLDVSPGVATRHMEGLKNPDGLNLGKCVFVEVYKVHMCTSMLKCGMRSGLTAFSLRHICSSAKAKQKV